MRISAETLLRFSGRCKGFGLFCPKSLHRNKDTWLWKPWLSKLSALFSTHYNTYINLKGQSAGRNEKKLTDAKEELERLYGIQVLTCQADGGVEEQVAGVIAKAAETFGRIDVLINNAQASKSGVLLVDHSKEDFDLAINSGLYAAFFYMKHAYPYLKAAQGSVINFASGAGISGRLGQSSYAAAKEGIRGMTRVAANEWGPDNINCNVVCPLVMTAQLKAWREQYPDLYEKTIAAVPMGRFGDPEKDIGQVCLFLASPGGKYITGETISLQGGSGMRP